MGGPVHLRPRVHQGKAGRHNCRFHTSSSSSWHVTRWCSRRFHVRRGGLWNLREHSFEALLLLQGGRTPTGAASRSRRRRARCRMSGPPARSSTAAWSTTRWPGVWCPHLLISSCQTYLHRSRDLSTRRWSCATTRWRATCWARPCTRRARPAPAVLRGRLCSKEWSVNFSLFGYFLDYLMILINETIKKFNENKKMGIWLDLSTQSPLNHFSPPLT